MVASCWLFLNNFYYDARIQEHQMPLEINSTLGSRDDTHDWIWGIHMLREVQGSRFQEWKCLQLTWKTVVHKVMLLESMFFYVHESVHRDTFMKVTNEMQLYSLIYYS